ncbi:host attachment protein [Arhodomonas sp. SL1]|uniref:host attachment protein n=1 Tax=Arhodomonas sp. SL1 TaxID=3425691 RepID=UPI003F883301
MARTCVVATEGARARFFTLEHAEVPELEGGPDLVEHPSLTNPRHRAHDEHVYSEVHSGRNRNASGQGQTYDEHRDNHDAELEHRFAKDIAEELNNLLNGSGAERVVLCAEKRMLGYLRQAINGKLSGEVRIIEVPKDLTKLSAHNLHSKLADDGHLPARRSGGSQRSG